MRYGISLNTAPASEPISRTEAKTHCRIEVTDDDGLVDTLIAAAREHVEAFTARAIVAQSWDFKLDFFPAVIPIPKPPLLSVSGIVYLDADGAAQTLASSVYTVDTDMVAGRIFLAYGQSWPGTYGVPNAVTVSFIAGMAAPFTAATSDTCTVKGRTFANGTKVRVLSSGTLPTGLAAGTDYFVVSASGATFKLSDSLAGAAIDITDAGTDTHWISTDFTGFDSIRAAMKLLVSHWYENREAVVVGTITSQLPLAVERLLWSHRVLEIP